MEINISVNDNIKLTAINEKNAQAIFELIDTNREYLTLWMPWTVNTKKVEDTVAFIKSIKKESIYDLQYPFEVWYNDKIIGTVGYNKGSAKDKKVDIGYWIAEGYQGKGIITKASKALIDYAFEKEDVHKIVVQCDPRNAKSSAIPERLGFTKEGTLRDNVFLGNEYCSSEIYGLLRHEWKKNE